MLGGGQRVEVWTCVGPSDWGAQEEKTCLEGLHPLNKRHTNPPKSQNHPAQTVVNHGSCGKVNLGKRSSWTSLQLGRSAASSTFSLLSVRWRANINLWPVVFAVLQSIQKVWILSLYKPVPSPVIFVGFNEAHYMNIEQISTDLTNISAPSFADLLTMARYLYTIPTCQSKHRIWNNGSPEPSPVHICNEDLDRGTKTTSIRIWYVKPSVGESIVRPLYCIILHYQSAS